MNAIPSPSPQPRFTPGRARILAVRWALWLAALGSLVILWGALCTVPGLQWNPPRFAPSYALAEGLNIYATRASGAHLGWFYGPVFALWGVPAAWVPQITWSFMVWALLNYVAIFGPVWLVLRDVAGEFRSAFAGCALFAVLLLANAITQSLVFVIHVDGLCVGLGTLACWSLGRAAAGRGGRFLHLAAVAVVLAVWTKQVAVSLVPGIFLWLWWTRQTRFMPTLFLWLVVYGGLITAGFFLWFGGEELLFNLWLVHAQNPRKGGWPLLGTEMGRMVSTAVVWWVATLLVLLARRPSALESTSGPLMRKLLGCVALCHLPLGLTAVLKAGGGLNSMHSLNYLLLLLVLGLLPLLRPAAAGVERASGVGRLGAGWGLLAVVGLGLGVAFHHAGKMNAQWLPYRGQEKMLATARASAGHIYFPWNPLLTLVTDRKVYPFDDALYCLHLARLAPSMAAVRAAVPPGAILYYEEPVQSCFALNYFPEFRAGPRLPVGGKP
ncbi:MAG: hypothetical protein PSV13_17730 [Lacunisphaera sp.]|nr:hypothetical protein [Lacunisphaera sp.]